ncbi:hypothetical protein LNKW23_26910 [Paralimibaculum aggregatum]|uniref:Secreted protein n=1 Tax=Paralimibaculum aggregatum TaxID=3036245 RepID=A0ABQ6LJP0_9RHOB|nr:hypothetical protein [Limibaculum sp. NKW23]GMG83478.1 hypothetical protein LNKW23_26910 [Limibaculum sp. NKW23]
MVPARTRSGLRAAFGAGLLAAFLCLPVAAEEPLPETAALAPAPMAEVQAGGLAAAPLDPALAGRIPGRKVEPTAPSLLLGATLGLLNTGGSGETIPLPYTGGD